MALYLSLKKITHTRYILIGGKHFLCNHTYESSSKILPNGDFISHYVIMSVYYSQVEEKKRFIIYNIKNDELNYKNELPEKSYGEETKVFVVSDLPDKIIGGIIADLIKKNEEIKK